MRIIGTKGSLTVDTNKPRIEVCADEPPWTPPQVDPDDPMNFWSSTQKKADRPKQNWIPLHGRIDPPNDASRFIDCVESGVESEMSARDGAAVTEVLMAGYASAAQGNVVPLPLPR